MTTKLFSLPLNPKMTEDFMMGTFVPFLNLNHQYIRDLYFTCRIPPFMQDAMGDVYEDPDMYEATTINALQVASMADLPLSATFNNIHVPPTMDNLRTWCRYFQPIYDAGVHIVTLPHTHWVASGMIQKIFPKLFIKNTILRNVTKAQEIVELAKAGFHYINLDRDLMRDHNALYEIKRAKDYCSAMGMPVEISILTNEGCWGGCPMMDEHYQYNCTKGPGNDVQYFADEISIHSCMKWDTLDSAASLKAAILPPWRDDWDELVDVYGIDCFKMHGRESMTRLKESMDIIERWAKGEPMLFPEFNKYIEDVGLEEKPIDIWRDKIKTCKFNCWDCNYCESVVDAHYRKQNKMLHPQVLRAQKAIEDALLHQSNFDETIYDVVGLSSNKVRHLLNNLCKPTELSEDDEVVYADLGCYVGSTLWAAMMGNKVKAYASDDYSQTNIAPARDDIPWEPIEDPVLDFADNAQKYMGSNSVVYIQKNIHSIAELNDKYKPEVIFYDAGHGVDETYANLCQFHQFATNTFTLVVDDCNFDGVTATVDKWVKDRKFHVLFKKVLRSQEIEDSNGWWNGVMVLVLDKNVRKTPPTLLTHRQPDYLAPIPETYIPEL
jgi:hypothetical protein